MKRTGSSSIVQRLISHNSHTSSLTKTTRQYFCLRNCVFKSVLSNKPNLIVPNNKLLCCPTTTTFGQIRTYTIATTNTSAPSSSEPITLNLMDYESWNAQQVASVFTAPKSLGGAGLSLADVKPLYVADFKGTNLHNIVGDIMKKDEYFALDQFKNTLTDSGFQMTFQLSDTCQTVVFWVLDQLMTRHYSLWQLEPVSKKIKQKLGEPIAKGGADLSLDQVSSLDSKTLHSIAKDVVSSKQTSVIRNLDLNLGTIVVQWVTQFLLQNNNIQIHLQNMDMWVPPFHYFSSSEREVLFKADEILKGKIDFYAKQTNMPDTHKRWYLSFCDLVMKGHAQDNRTPSEKESYTLDLIALVSNARDIVFSNVNTESILNKSKFETVMKNMVNDLLEGSHEDALFMRKLLTPFNERCSSQFVRDVLVPINSEKKITKDLFPFIPKLQVDLFNEDERKTLDQKIRDGSTICIIGPSGVGKTALLARRLGVNPGIMITCSSLTDQDRLTERGIDHASVLLREVFVATMNQSIIKLYGTALQQVQCNLIARLLCLHTALTIWEKTDNKIPFETPLQMLSYSQWNVNTYITATIFKKLLERQWLSVPTEILRDFTIFLIEQLYSRLKLDLEQPFIIALDEANLFSNIRTPMLSTNGTPRDLLSLIAFEISRLRQKSFMKISVKISDIYCGTMFTTDIIDIIQSSIGKLEDIARVYSCVGLDSITFEQALQILDKMYDIEGILKLSNTSKTDLYRSVQHIFPTRRRVVGLVASHLEITTSLKKSFTDKWEEFVGQVEKNVLNRLSQKTSKDRLDANFLLDVVVTNEYDAFLGKSISCDRELASSLIGTGLAKPNFDFCSNSNKYHFDTSDPILRHVARKVLEQKYPNSISKVNNSISVLNSLLTLPQHDPKKWEMVFSLLLQHHSGKFIKDNLILSPLILGENSDTTTERKKRPYSQLLDHKFVIKSFIRSNDFYRKYYTSKWAQEVFKKENSSNKNILGDVLYFHCLLNYNKHMEEYESSANNISTFADIIDGLYFYPSEYCHADGICLNFSEQPYGIIVSNKLHNCQRDKFLEHVKKGVKSVNANNFYKEKFGTNLIAGCSWWTTEKQEFITTLTNNERLIPLIAHIHVKYKQITTKKGVGFTEDYTEKGKYLIMNPDSNGLRSLCPDLFQLLRKNLFETATIDNLNTEDLE
ncbi:hypothetical protein C9374_003230 [Naegleria lovaniensis]|uniref:Uncharacterized protein n=1 Tax=Naegleria lovaniensis TaxID=51637 RepID=A0AA88KM53_NAELO|nr:uncharacterized protein C9374_003230 [Naegleria lovaniensis]KAG2386081.1 hypothetical protein C9374_003230 [Naegleria lovaniensis]